MEKKKTIGCIPIVISSVVIVLILEYFTEQLAKLDWFTNLIIGIFLLGVILLVIHKTLH